MMRMRWSSIPFKNTSLCKELSFFHAFHSIYYASRQERLINHSSFPRFCKGRMQLLFPHILKEYRFLLFPFLLSPCTASRLASTGGSTWLTGPLLGASAPSGQPSSHSPCARQSVSSTTTPGTLCTQTWSPL